MALQKIYYGAPGTGKSHKVKELLGSVPTNKIFRTTIHPDYTYTDFVGQLLPKKTSSGVDFDFKDGVFTKALKEAYSDSNYNVYLVIEELSRGNASGIFGDIFQLLDRDNHFVSRYPIINDNIANRIPELPDDNVLLPANFNILCTINTNDQGVFPMDNAFKRRFDWEYVSTSPVLNSLGNVDTHKNNPLIQFIGSDGTLKETSWINFYLSLNEFITDKVDGLGKKEDKQIGQFFIEFTLVDIVNSNTGNPTDKAVAIKNINEFIKNKLLQYLWNDIQSTIYDDTKRLFSNTIVSFEFLYNNFSSIKVFDDLFLKAFLEKNLARYKY